MKWLAAAYFCLGGKTSFACIAIGSFPMMHKIGMRPVLLLMTEIGSYGKFLDIYRYDSLAQYEELTDRLLSHPELQSYYAEVGECILGSISIEIMREMPY